MSEFLDYPGLEHYNKKIKSKFFGITGVKQNYVDGIRLLSTGAAESKADTLINDRYIPCTSGSTIVWKHGFTSVNTTTCLIRYDSNFNVLGYYSVNTTAPRTLTPSDANLAYIRASFSSDASANPSLTINGKVAWERQDHIKMLNSEYFDEYSKEIALSNSGIRDYALQFHNKYGTGVGYKHKLVDVTPGEKYLIKASETSTRYAYFASIDTPTSGGILPLVSGTMVEQLLANDSQLITIPNGCVALAIYYGTDPYLSKPELYLISDSETALIRKLLNIDSEWEQVNVSFGRLGTGESSFAVESSTSLCFTSAIHARRGDIFRGRWYMRGRASNGSAVYKTNAENTVGVSPLVEVDYNGLQNIEFTIEEDCYITLQVASTTVNNVTLFVKHTTAPGLPGNGHKTDAYPFENELGYHRVLHWKNGSIANKANANGIHCESYDIPDGVSALKFKTTRPLPTGHAYWLTYRWINASGTSISATDASANTDISIPIGVPSGATRFYLSVFERDLDSDQYVSLRYYDMDGYESWITPYQPGYVAYTQDNEIGSVYALNKERAIELAAICRANMSTSSPYQDYETLVISDEHGDTVSSERAVIAANDFGTIKSFINCGDICKVYHNPVEIDGFHAYFEKLKKPGYVVPGNHDAGNAYYVGYGGSHEQMYHAFIKPMVDAGYLAEGEYTVNKPYWFHDDTTYKIRLIGVYEWDSDLALASNNYWEPVAYDSSAPSMAFSTAYNVGDVVNCGNYIDYSFRCISALTTPVNQVTDIDKIPCYKVHRGMRVIGETQANWFLNALATTPANYGVIIITHQPISNSAEIVTSKFTEVGLPATSIQNAMATDFLAEAISAFSGGNLYSKPVVMSGTAAYMNTQTSDGVSCAYSVSKDFSQKESGAYVLGMLCGHRHRDVVYNLNGICQVGVTCAHVATRDQQQNTDIRRTRDTSISRDSITVASFAERRIGLAKLGVNVTMNGTKRDIEVINTAE